MFLYIEHQLKWIVENSANLRKNIESIDTISVKYFSNLLLRNHKHFEMKISFSFDELLMQFYLKKKPSNLLPQGKNKHYGLKWTSATPYFRSVCLCVVNTIMGDLLDFQFLQIDHIYLRRWNEKRVNAIGRWQLLMTAPRRWIKWN